VIKHIGLHLRNFGVDAETSGPMHILKGYVGGRVGQLVGLVPPDGFFVRRALRSRGHHLYYTRISCINR
jgi:hypothetical protein